MNEITINEPTLFDLLGTVSYRQEEDDLWQWFPTITITHTGHDWQAVMTFKPEPINDFQKNLTVEDMDACLDRIEVQDGVNNSGGYLAVYNLPSTQEILDHFLSVRYDYAVDNDSLDEAMQDCTYEWFVDSIG